MKQETLTEQAQEVIVASQQLAMQLHHNQWDVEHILLALLQQEKGLVSDILVELGVDVGTVRQEVEPALEKTPRIAYEVAQLYSTPRVLHLAESAKAEADRLKDEFIGTEHLLIAIIGEEKGEAAAILKRFGIDQEKVYRALQALRGGHHCNDVRAEGKYRCLEKYGYDLTEMARQSKLEPVVGRDSEVNQLVVVLTKKTRNSPLLVGDITVDKFSIVEGLAQRIALGNVPSLLLQKKIIVLDLGKLVAGAKFRGEFEERIEAVLTDVDESQGTIIPYFDELWVGVADGGLDIGSILKFPLAIGKFQCISATVPKYLEFFGEKGLLGRQFEVITIGKPGSSTDFTQSP